MSDFYGLLVFYLVCGFTAYVITLADSIGSVYKYCKSALPKGTSFLDVSDEIFDKVESLPVASSVRTMSRFDRMLCSIRVIVAWPYYAKSMMAVKEVFMKAAEEVVQERNV